MDERHHGEIAYGFEHESWQAKIAWFGTLAPLERLRHLDSMYRLAVSLNPKLRGGNDAGYATTAVRVVELPPR